MSGLMSQLLSMPAWLAIVVVFALPALESSAFVGFLFPGETAVILGGVVASQGHVPLAAVLAAAIAGAVLGDAVGFAVGRRWGRGILGATLGRIVDERHLARAEQELAGRGGWAVFLGRFTVALRVLVPGLAGMARMPFRRFAVANALGGAVWGGLMVTAGYLAGNSWHAVEHYLTGAGLALTVLVVVSLVVARHLGRRIGRRAAPRHRGPRTGWRRSFRRASRFVPPPLTADYVGAGDVRRRARAAAAR